MPYNTGWHLAHHVDMGVPWRNLPAFHRELVAAGWITPGLEHPSYTALWRKLSSRDSVLSAGDLTDVRTVHSEPTPAVLSAQERAGLTRSPAPRTAVTSAPSP